MSTKLLQGGKAERLYNRLIEKDNLWKHKCNRVKGLFARQYQAGTLYFAFDNTSGEFFNEEFSTEKRAMKWLKIPIGIVVGQVLKPQRSTRMLIVNRLRELSKLAGPGNMSVLLPDNLTTGALRDIQEKKFHGVNVCDLLGFIADMME